MTIATLMATCLIFVSIGWKGDVFQSVALVVGGIVCIAAANAGATSQDLKTGYIVGATPIWQQIGLVIGVLVSTFAVGMTLQWIDGSMAYKGIPHAIGTEKFAAPQATLMATIIKGLLAQDLPWALVFIGMAISVVVELCGIRSLSFAVGVYLPLSTTFPIFVGGALKALVDKVRGVKEESEVSPGMLYSTGLVAGGSLTGVLIAVLSGITFVTLVGGAQKEVSVAEYLLDTVGIHGWESMGAGADLIGALMFGLLSVVLVRTAMKKD